jgi:YHS domain-containing protein
MQGLFSLLMFAAFFYLMMRFGCGAHMVHGHGGHEPRGSPEGNTKDPVCGMNVAAGAGYSKIHQGRQYRFCSRKCLDQFDAEPKVYVAGTGGM